VPLVVLDFVLLLEYFQLQFIEKLVDSLEYIETHHPHMIGVAPAEIDGRLQAVLTTFLVKENEQIDDMLGYKIQTMKLLIEIILYLFGDLNMNSLNIDVHGTLLSVM
jgi:hypothetical protein